MSTEIIVDRELLQNQMKDLLELFSFMENDGKYSINDKEITLYYERQNAYKSIEYLDLDAVHAKYSEMDLEIQTIGGITFVSSDNVALECGILKDTLNDKSNTAVTDVIFGATRWGLEVYDEDNNVKHNYTNYSGILNNVVNILRFTSGVNKSFANNGVNYDAVIDMGVKTSGLLGEYSIGLFSNMTMRAFVKDVLNAGIIELEAGIPFTIAEPESDDVKIAWSDGQPVIGVTSNNSSVTDFITGVQNQMVLGLYNFYKRYLSRELFAQFELDSNIYVDGEAVVKAQNTVVQVDPLILDLNGNGIYTTTVDNGTHFDFQEDGFKERTAWLDNGDGFLVYDINGDGRIDNAGELFGDRTLLEDGSYAKNGYEAIKQYDIDNNNQINYTDDIFEKLKIWIDENANGITDAGELTTLEELGIRAINIGYKKTNNKDSNGNTILGQTDVVLNNNESISMAALNFQTNMTDTVLENEMEIPDTILYGMPDLEGSGKVLSLQQAMSINTELYDLVKQYMYTLSCIERYQLAENIMIKWAGCGDEVEGSRGNNVDATHLAVIEAFYGTEYAGVDGRNPNRNAGPILEGVYQDLLSQVRNGLILNVFGVACIMGINHEDNQNTSIDEIDIMPALQYLNETYKRDKTIQVEILSVVIQQLLSKGHTIEKLGSEEVDKKFIEYGFEGLADFCTYKIMYVNESKAKYGSSDNEFIICGDGNNIIFSEGGNDIIYGGAGDDVITDTAGTNEWYGGTGNDTLISLYGVENYHFEAGDGQDIIRQKDQYYDRKGDKILFGESVNKEDIYARKEGNHLILENTASGDTITIEEAYRESDGSYHIKEILFADGSALTAEEIAAMVQKQEVHGTEDDDVVRGLNNHYAYDNDEVLHGYAGDDKIYGYDGDDIIYGDEGNDTIYAGYGNNTVYGGEGNDAIYTEGDNDIIYGGAGDDVMTDSSGENEWYGGKGNDTFISLYGVETYHFEAGDGQDIIRQGNLNFNRKGDKILFGESVNKEDIYARKVGNHLILENTASGDTITIEEAYKERDGRYHIKEILFADGSALTADEIAAMVQKQEVHGTDGDDVVRGLNEHYAYDNDEVLHGYAGNDKIYGYDGDDIIYGDEGNDTIYAGYGNNTVYGGEGNDAIYTEGDNDILYGGAGDDILNGGYGDDIYVFNQGDGQDKISDRYGNNQISFGEGIGVSNLLISTQNNDVAINFMDSEDMLTLVDGLRYDAYKNFELTFIDGSTGTIDLSGEIGAVVIDETVIDDNTVEEIVADESVAETQVLQMVDVMNTESGENISVVENIVTTNTVEETLLFVEP